MEYLLGKSIGELELGESAERSKTITESDIVIYAGITGDFNPIHVNEEYAKKTIFGGRIAHGSLVSGLMAPVIGMQLPGMGSIAYQGETRFQAPVKIGDTITARAVVEAKNLDKNIVIMKLQWINQRGEVVIQGAMKVLPPKKA